MFVILLIAAAAACTEYTEQFSLPDEDDYDYMKSVTLYRDDRWKGSSFIWNTFPKIFDGVYLTISDKKTASLTFKDSLEDNSGYYELSAWTKSTGRKILGAVNHTWSASPRTSLQEITQKNGTLTCGNTSAATTWYVVRDFVTKYNTPTNSIKLDDYNRIYCETSLPCSTSKLYIKSQATDLTWENDFIHTQRKDSGNPITVKGCWGAQTEWFLMPNLKEVFAYKDDEEIAHMNRSNVMVWNSVRIHWADGVRFWFFKEAAEGNYSLTGRSDDGKIYPIADINYIPRDYHRDAFDLIRVGNRFYCKNAAPTVWVTNHGTTHNRTGNSIEMTDFTYINCFIESACEWSKKIYN